MGSDTHVISPVLPRFALEGKGERTTDTTEQGDQDLITDLDKVGLSVAFGNPAQQEEEPNGTPYTEEGGIDSDKGSEC